MGQRGGVAEPGVRADAERVRLKRGGVRDQPIAVALAANPYSSNKQAATTNAANSPTVAYANEYEDPEAGIRAASSE